MGGAAGEEDHGKREQPETSRPFLMATSLVGVHVRRGLWFELLKIESTLFEKLVGVGSDIVGHRAVVVRAVTIELIKFRIGGVEYGFAQD